MSEASIIDISSLRGDYGKRRWGPLSPIEVLFETIHGNIILAERSLEELAIEEGIKRLISPGFFYLSIRNGRVLSLRETLRELLDDVTLRVGLGGPNWIPPSTEAYLRGFLER